MRYVNTSEILGNVYFTPAIDEVRRAINNLVEELITQYVPDFDELDSDTQESVRDSIYVELLERA